MKTQALYLRTLLALILSAASMLVQAQNKVVAYVPNWIDLNSYSTQIDYAKLTHINIAFENPVNSAGDLSFNSQNNVLINRAHANNVKIFMSIGGGAASGDQALLSRYFSLITPANRQAFVNKLVNYVVSHNLDGLDVDLEGPSINADYGGFISVLAPALKAQGKGITAALSQGYGGDKVPSSVFTHFDWVNIMAYDGAGYWDPNAPGQHSSFDFAVSNTNYWLNRGLPRSKAVLGVPFYGYGFGAAFRNRDYSYKEIINAYPGAENTDQVGSTIWYNGIPTIKRKTNWAFDQGIGGIMIWSLDYDGTGNKSLLTAINSVFVTRGGAPTVTITSPANNSGYAAPASITINATATDGDGIAKVEFFNGTTLLGADATSPYSFTWSNVAKGRYTITVKATDTKGSSTSAEVNVGVQGSYNASAFNIPGKIEAEQYDLGGEGVAYHDADAANTGAVYRTDGVDIQACTDTDAGYNLGWMTAGEWTEYSVNVTAAGKYNFQFRVASINTGKTFHVELDGANISGTVTVPNTGAWQTWQTVSVNNVTLTAGQKTLRLVMDTDGFNFNYINTVAVVENQLPTITLTSPLNNATATAPASLTLSANAADADGSVAKVDFYNGTTLLSSDATAPYSYVWNNVTAGTYTITARVTDNTGAVVTSSAATIVVSNAPTSCYQLTWSDEFNGTSLDQSKWNYQTGNGCPGICGWGNNELEYYTSSTNNVSVSGGNLALTARYEPNYNGTGNNYTSGKIVTSGKFSQKYGRYEANIKVPSATAVWPAFWMLADNTQWPATGEIDILETANANPTLWYGTLHYASTANVYQRMGVQKNFSTPLSSGFHVYAVEWSTTEIKWFIDDVLMGTVTKAALQANGGNWPFDNQNFYIILNVAVGGNFTGNVTPNNAQYPAAMLVDYVRVYQKQTNCIVPQTPFGGTAQAIPGIIQAENYDLGGEGVAYHDGDATNTGAVYRNDGVDVQATTDVNGGYNLGWTTADEWTEYTVNVAANGTYNMKARVAATAAGKSFRVELDGATLATIAVPNTGGWQTWQEVSVNNLNLTAGQKVLRIYNITDGFNLNYLSFASTVVSPNTPPTVSVSVPSGTYAAPATITINATAADTDGSVTKVEFYNGTTLLGTDNTAPYSYSWTGVMAGAYNVSAKATDNEGAVTTSNTISVVVNATVPNAAPTVSVSIPSGSYTAPAAITINATAADSDGSVSKVEFYNGATLLGSDATAPYSFSWTNVVAGTYNVTAKATDDKGAATTSSSVSVTVNPSTNPCTGIAQYKENNGYVAGSKVQNGGKVYQCKPYPYTGWCNGAAWAYAPGTGSAWQDAWTQVGSCTSARMASAEEAQAAAVLSPNPTEGTLNVTFTEFATADVSIVDLYDREVLKVTNVSSGAQLDMSAMNAGMYVVKINSGETSYTYTIVKR